MKTRISFSRTVAPASLRSARAAALRTIAPDLSRIRIDAACVSSRSFLDSIVNSHRPNVPTPVPDSSPVFARPGVAPVVLLGGEDLPPDERTPRHGAHEAGLPGPDRRGPEEMDRFLLRGHGVRPVRPALRAAAGRARPLRMPARRGRSRRSEEHTSELQSRLHLVCRLLLEKKKQD